MELTLEGDIELQRKVAALCAQGQPQMRAALYEEATELLNDADLLVPVDTGTLKGSKFRFDDSPWTGGRVEMIAGYGGAAAPYALAVHENPRSGKTGGVGPSGQKYQHWAQVGEWKYLETPFKRR